MPRGFHPSMILERIPKWRSSGPQGLRFRVHESGCVKMRHISESVGQNRARARPDAPRVQVHPRLANLVGCHCKFSSLLCPSLWPGACAPLPPQRRAPAEVVQNVHGKAHPGCAPAVAGLYGDNGCECPRGSRPTHTPTSLLLQQRRDDRLVRHRVPTRRSCLGASA